MKSFLKYVLATFVGMLLTTFILSFIFIGILGVIIASQEKVVEVKPNTVLYLKLDKPIVDRKPVLPFYMQVMADRQQIGLDDILESIDKAAGDDRIEGIHLDLNYLSAGIGTIEEIRNALLEFRASGKFVTVYSDYLTQGAYYLASAADEIYFNPEGFFSFVGLRTQSFFLKGALEKLDIEPTLIRRGSFKSAGEQFTEKGYSDENREQLSKLINSIWDGVIGNIARERGLTVEALDKMADELKISGGSSALNYGLVDQLAFKDEVLDSLRSKTGMKPADEVRSVMFSDYIKAAPASRVKGAGKQKIAIIFASGEIITGEGDENTIGSDKYGRLIRKIRSDSTIKAVVLRVNSPGGSAIASEVILRELMLTREVKPVIVSMGDVAASGGYYISCMADSIIAQPNTITGSIGVISMFLNVEGFFNRYGITFDTEKTNEYSDFMSALRPPRPAEVAYWEMQTDSIYQTFLQHVSKGRDMKVGEVHAIGQGRIWSGTDAVDIGLVDKMGGIDDAIEAAAAMADLGEAYRLVEYPEQPDPLEQMLKELAGEVRLRIFNTDPVLEEEYQRVINQVRNYQGPMTRMPFDLSIY